DARHGVTSTAPAIARAASRTLWAVTIRTAPRRACVHPPGPRADTVAEPSQPEGIVGWRASATPSSAAMDLHEAAAWLPEIDARRPQLSHRHARPRRVERCGAPTPTVLRSGQRGPPRGPESPGPRPP